MSNPYDPKTPHVSPEIVGPREHHEARVKSGFWPKVMGALSKVPFAEDAIAAYFCAFDPKTPRSVRASLLAALAYFIVPTDAMPDMIAMLGYVDDATVLATTIKLVSDHITGRHRSAAKRALADYRDQTEA